MTKERILIVEDDVGTRGLLELNIESWGYDVVGAENGEIAIECVENELFHLVVLDIEMPGIDGFEVCRHIRKQYDIPIIFISSRRALMDKLKCFELGGDDYITKPFNFAELEARIKSNVRRYRKMRSQLLTSTLTCGQIEINLDLYECYVNGKKVNLTPTEMNILIYLAKHPNQVLDVEQIFDHIWGYDTVGDPQTIKVHIRNLRQKVEKDPYSPQHIITVRGFGYRFIC